MFIDPLYIMLALPALILAGIASVMTQTTFKKYSQVEASSGLTGAEAAQRLLAGAQIQNVKIEEVQGFLSDHYDPIRHTLRLSPGVYQSTSLSAIGVACHEAGHAIQHARHFAPLYLRSALVPAAQIGTFAPYIFFILGFLLKAPNLILLGIGIFAVAVLFSLITLPVEWNASSRAKQLMVSAGIISAAERDQAAQVLNAAFLTYVAAAVSALLTLLYYLIRFGFLGGGRRNA